MCQDELGSELMIRGLYYKEDLADYTISAKDGEPEFICWTNEPEKLVHTTLAGRIPNLIGSKVKDFDDPMVRGKYHAPVLDFDFPCRLVPLSTPGHFHFYIDTYVEESWHLRFLKNLCDIGLLQTRVYKSAKAHGQTYLRWNTTKQKEGLM